MNPKLKCVMLVDDDRLTNFLNKILIDDTGITDHVERCTSVQSALGYISSSLGKETDFYVPNLIFLDMRMPEQPGWKFIDYYRLIKQYIPQQPVIIILSSDQDAQDVLDAPGLAEISGIYTKPLTAEIIQSVMVQYFTGYHY